VDPATTSVSTTSLEAGQWKSTRWSSRWRLTIGIGRFALAISFKKRRSSSERVNGS